MELSLAGRTALVGGASQGIGKGCAEALASAGAAVVLMARSPEALDAVRASLPTPSGQTHRSRAVDFRDWRVVGNAVRAEVEQHGPITIVLNNTGGPGVGSAREASPAAFVDGVALHVGSFQATLAEVQHGMVEARYGRVINIISTSVVSPIRNLGVSNTVRGAVANWGRTLATELGPHGITVNNVLPGYIDTERLATSTIRRAELAGTTPQAMAEAITASVPVGRLGTPADIGAVVAFLASPAAAYVNGINLPVDGGRLVALNT